MKILLPAIIAFALTLSLQNLNAQNSFSNARWLSLGYGTFTPLQGSYLQAGPDYGCATNATDPVWFFISTCGHATGSVTLGVHGWAYNNYYGRTDSMSLVLWGPFIDTTNLFSQLTAANTVTCNTEFSQNNYDNDIITNVQVEPSRFYYGVVTSTDSIYSVGISAGWPIYFDEYDDSFYCTICHGLSQYMVQPICIITVDSLTEKNHIFWAPEDSSIADYIIYRQSSSFGQYDSIGIVEKGEPTDFIDYNSDPLVKSYTYKLGTKDSCERIYSANDYQTTMHLTTSAGLNGEVNLVWNPYGISEFYPSFYIFRSVNGDPFEAIDSIASNTTTYTDLNPPAGELHYKVGIRTPSCYNGGDEFTYSNRSSTGAVGIQNAALPEGVSLFPNPAHDIVQLKLATLAEQVKSINVVSTSGKEVMNISKPSGATIAIDVHAFASGIYFLELQTDEMIYRVPMAVQ